MAFSVSNQAIVVLLLILMKGIDPVSAYYSGTNVVIWKWIIIGCLAGLVGLILLIIFIILGIKILVTKCKECCMPSRVGTVSNTPEQPNAGNTPMALQSYPDNSTSTSAINPSA